MIQLNVCWSKSQSNSVRSPELLGRIWLRLPERVNFKLTLMAYRVQHGLAPAYLNQLVPVSDLPGRRRLRSSSTLGLFVPSYPLGSDNR